MIRLPMDCEVAVPKKRRGTVLGFESVSLVTLGVYRFLLDSVDDTLSGCEVNRALAGDRLSDGTSLGCMLAFALDGDGGASEDVELAFGSSEFVHFAHLGRWCDRVVDAGFGDSRFGAERYELVPVGSNSNARIFWFGRYHIGNSL